MSNKQSTYGKLRVHMFCDEISRLIDRVVERVRTNRIIVCVSNIDSRNSSKRDERSVVTSRTKHWQSAQHHVVFVK